MTQIKDFTDEEAFAVGFKRAFLLFEMTQLDEAYTQANRLTIAKTKATELLVKTKDLELELLKRLDKLQLLSQNARAQADSEASPERKKKLMTIAAESSFTLLQKESGLTAQQKSKNWLEFARENSSQKELARKAFLESLKIQSENLDAILWSESIQEFAKAYPDSSENIPLIKQASAKLVKLGFFPQAQALLEASLPLSDKKQKSETMEALLELAFLEKQNDQVRSLLRQKLKEAPKAEQGAYYDQLLKTYPPDSNEARALLSEIQKNRIEPTASHLDLDQVEKMLAKRQFTEAFQAAKKFVGSGATNDIKARARVLQAQVLENEFTQQSLRSPVDRLQIVLAMKTDKFEKAQSAYLSASKLSGQPEYQKQALEGLARLYSHFATALKNWEPKGETAPEQIAGIRKDLAQLINPLEKQNLEMVDQLNKLKIAGPSRKPASLSRFAGLSEAETPSPMAGVVDFERVDILGFPILSDETQLTWDFGKSKKCLEPLEKMSTQELTRGLQNCVATQSSKQILSYLKRLSLMPDGQELTAFYNAYFAWLERKTEKTQHLLKSIETDKKGTRLSFNTSTIEFLKVLAQPQVDFTAWRTLTDKGETHVVARYFTLQKFFQDGDCLSALERLSKDKSPAWFEQSILLQQADCLGQVGKMDEALKLLRSESLKDRQFEKLLQEARVWELYKKDNIQSRKLYEQAKMRTTQPDALDWLNRKLEYLKGTENQIVGSL